METKERFVRLKQHVERFGFLLDLNSFLQGGSHDVRLQRQARDKFFRLLCLYDELSASALYDGVMDVKMHCTTALWMSKSFTAANHYLIL